MKTVRLAALVSGSGSNLQAIIDAISKGELKAEIVQVIASKHNLPAQARASLYHLPYEVVERRTFGSDIEGMSDKITSLLEPQCIDLVILCGFLSFLGERMLSTWSGRIMNIHPSLLPAFGGAGMYGKRVHEAVLAYGCKVSGCTVMFVDEGKDTGPIILQKAVHVQEYDTPDTLAARVMLAENEAYPEAVRLFAEGRLRISGRRVIIHES